MKKFLFILFLSFLVPVNVFAISISSANITVPSEIEAGKGIPVTINVNFDGLDKTLSDTKGIVSVAVSINSNISFIKDIDGTSSWDLASSETDNDMQKIIVAAPNSNTPNLCHGNLLSCGNFQATVYFYPEEIGNISEIYLQLSDVLGILLPVSTKEEDVENKEYLEKNMELLAYTSNISKTIKVMHSTDVVVETPKDPIEPADNSNIVDSIKSATPSAPVTSQSPSTPVTPRKSTNTFLKSLEITGYEIPFDSNKDYYELYVENEEVNSLEIKAEVEDVKSTYQVRGSDNLKDNSNRVTIDVISEAGTKRTYTINVKVKHEYTPKEQEETVKILKFDVKKKYVKWGIIAVAIIIILVVIKIIFKITKDRVEHRKYYKAVKTLKK